MAQGATKGSCYCGHAFAIPVAEVAIDSEVEGDAVPEGAPPPGEQGSPHGRFGGEEADDDEQHVIGEAADEVQARRMRFWLEPPPLVGCLTVHLNRRRRRRTRVLVCVVGWVCASASFCACRRAVVNCARVRPSRGRSVPSIY